MSQIPKFWQDLSLHWHYLHQNYCKLKNLQQKKIDCKFVNYARKVGQNVRDLRQWGNLRRKKGLQHSRSRFIHSLV